MRITAHLPAGAEGAGEARKAIDALGRETSHDVLSTLGLLVSELVVNGPEHAGQDPGDAVLLEIETSRTSIHAEVIQLGTGEAVRATKEQDRRSAWDLFLLQEMSSRWGILEGSSNGVWVEIDRWSEATLGPRN
jgi:anti-sigma regulatory factor (Ser/Thr protein kinase)